MQDRDISPTEFHKVLKYRKLKTDIRNQAKAKVKEITKEQRVELLEQGRKEGKEDFLRKISNTSGTRGVNAIYNMNLLHPTVCDFMVHKDYKNRPKIYLSSMLNQLQDSTPHLSSYQSLYHHPSLYFFEVPPMRVSSLYLPSAFDHILFGQWLAVSEVHPGMPYSRDIWTKNNLLIHCDSVFDGLFKLFFCFHAVSTWYIQLFCKF